MLAEINSSSDARARDRASVLATLVAAFEQDKAVRMLYPADAEYHRHFPGFLMAFGGRAFDEGAVDEDVSGRSAALWFPPGVEPDGEAIMRHLESSLAADRFNALAAGFETQSQMHPVEPHWYLPWMGVIPDAQNKGLGSALLRRGLARADADAMPAYLEATSPENAALYARHGFEVTGIVKATDYPEIVCMWRPAVR